ncbi:hypothetical protein B7939_00625 [Eggerthia catenaformis]|nr:hypothetical protein B7939_00625 [Eggerthia catenaformis]
MDKEYIDKLNQSYDVFLSNILVIYKKTHKYKIEKNKEDTEILKEFLKCYSILKDAALKKN